MNKYKDLLTDPADSEAQKERRIAEAHIKMAAAPWIKEARKRGDVAGEAKMNALVQQEIKRLDK